MIPRPYEFLHTARLDLFCLTADELREHTLINRRFDNPHGVYIEEPLPRANRIADVEAHPENIRWYYRIMVDRERNIAVGSIAFHAAPDERGMIEVGLGVADAERGRGYATEALEGIWRWVIDEPGVKFLRYTVSPTNAPSLAIIAKFNFPEIGVQIDDEDGPELIFEQSVAVAREQFGML